MTKFKVSLVALENHDVPKWVYNEMSKNKISFLVNECTTKSELTTNPFDADDPESIGNRYCCCRIWGGGACKHE